MTKTDQIKQAIHDANLFKSRLSPDALSVPGLTSLKIRHLLNNLGAISKNYFEIGSHRGGTFCSAIYNNPLETVTACDDYSEFQEQNPMADLLSNVGKHKMPETKFKMIASDCWEIKELPSQIDLFHYDGNHSYESQRKAVTHFLPFMADEFIFCVDDMDLPQVTEGTAEGMMVLRKMGYEVLFEQHLKSTEELPNETWHQGFYVALISKI